MRALAISGEGTDAEGARLGWRTRTLSSSSLNLGFALSLFNLLPAPRLGEWGLSQGSQMELCKGALAPPPCGGLH